MDNSNKKILIIEDDPSIASALELKISSAGYEVLMAEDGEIGLKKALSDRPNMILLDIILPKLDGMTLLENLRQDEWGKTVPVIILSNLGTGDELNRSQEHGVKEFLIKTDWTLDDVVKKIKDNIQ